MISIRWARESLAGRLSLYFGFGTLLIIALLGSVLFVVVERQVQMRDTNELSSKTRAIEKLLASIDQPADMTRLVSQIRATQIGHEDLDIGILIDGIWVLRPDPSIINHARHHPAAPDISNESQMTFSTSNKQWAMHHFTHQLTALPETTVQAVVAIEVTETTRLVASLRNALIAIGLAGTAMIAALTWIATARALAPLKRIAHEAERVTAEALGQPLSVENTPVEIRGLVTSINQMLSRLQKSFASLDQFSADIAHELRTPVNALLTQTQVTLSRERSIEEYTETLHLSLEELNRLQRMVADMLFIARADRNVNTTPFELTDITETATQVMEYVELIASENDQTISIEGELTALGDPLMLRRAITNLLGNAVRYAPAGANILLTLSADDDFAVVRVTNPFAQAVSQADVERLFDRFYRLSPDGLDQSAGLGLGLPIVQSIMRVHGGRATAGHTHGLFWGQLRWPKDQH